MKTLVRTITENIKNHPEKIAIVYQNERITYGELDNYIDAIAWKLLKYKDIDGTVGIMMERSVYQIATMLACMKLGIVYIPIDNRYPAARVNEIQEDSHMVACVVDNDKNKFSREVNYIDVNHIEWNKKQQLEVTDSKGCIYFTSGSSGKPKGIQLSGSYMDEFVFAALEHINIPYGASALYNVSISYIVALYLVLGPLVKQGTIYILPDGMERDIKEQVDMINRNGIMCSLFVPSILQYVGEYCIRTGEQLACDIVLVAGEPLKISVMEHFKSCYHNKMFNVYGSTELCGARLIYDCRNCGEYAYSLPLGENVGDKILHIIDEDRNESEEGELCFNVKRSDVRYMNSVEEDKKYIIKNPFYAEGGKETEYLLKTGDYVKKTAQGLIYVDRMDSMLKLNGQRIDLREIEERITSLCEGVAECVVNKEVHANSEYLAAYLKFNESRTGEEKLAYTNVLRDKLTQVLMVYMVPTVYYEVAEWKYNINGKLDRRNLHKIGSSIADFKKEEDYSGEDTITASIIEIWKKILGTENVGENSDFFMLGGNSVQMIKLIAEVEKQLQCTVNIQKCISSLSPVNMRKCLTEGKKEKRVTDDTEETLVTPLMLSYHTSKLSEEQFLPTFSYIELDIDFRGHMYWEKRLEAIVEKYDVFRGVIENNQYKVTEKAVKVKVTYNDISQLSTEKAKQQLAITREKETTHGFAANELPGIRLHVTRLNDLTERLHIYAEGLRLDGYNMMRISRMLVSERELRDYPYSFESYLKYGQKSLSAEELEKCRERIADLPTGAVLPRADKNEAEGNIKQYFVNIPSEYMEQVLLVAKQTGVSVFAVLLTVFGNTLSHWQEETSFTISVPISRNISEAENYAPGVYSDFILYDYKYDNKIAFADMVKNNHRHLLDIINRSPVSGIELLRMWQQEQPIALNETRVPIVFGDMTQYGIQADTEFIYNHTLGIQIEANLIKNNEEYGIMLNTTENAVSEYAIDSFVKSLRESIYKIKNTGEFLENPLTWQLPKFDKAVLEKSNSVYDYEIAYRPFGEVILENTEKYRDKVAFYYNNKQYTYGDLKKSVWCYASFLKEKGVKRNSRVMIYMDKSAEQYIAVLAVHMLGAVYVPFDKAFSEEFIGTNIQNIGISFIIADTPVKVDAEDCKILLPFSQLSPDYIPSEVMPELKRNPNETVTIIFTSGSTGMPNAVPITCGGLYNAVMFAVREFNISSDDTIISLTDLAHDMSTFDVFGMLMAGGTLVIPTEKERRDPICWLEWLERYGVSVWNSVPAFLEMLTSCVEDGDEFLFEKLRLIITGGDYLSVPVLKQIRSMNEDIRIVSVGGPTEISLWNICSEITQKDLEHWTVPYGYSIANADYYILNSLGEQVPVGVTGRMCSSGIGKMTGYLNNADSGIFYSEVLENEVIDMGDRGYMDEDGLIHFAGRKDAQIKINGKRINLAAIETELIGILGLDSFATVIKQEGQNELCAYYTSQVQMSETDIQNQLKKCIPEYMIPQHIIWLEEMPFNRSGKIDRKLLKSLNISIDDTEQISLEPENAIEKNILEYARTLISNKNIHVNQNFIKSGADSISLVRMAAWIKKEYATEISLQTMFEKPYVHSWYEAVITSNNELLTANE